MESKPRKRRPHPARRSRRVVGAGSVAAMLTLTGGLAVAGAQSNATVSSSKATTTSTSAGSASTNTSATTDTTGAAATSATAGSVSSQPNTVSSGS
jgi:hypothetical protein